MFIYPPELQFLVDLAFIQVRDSLFQAFLVNMSLKKCELSTEHSAGLATSRFEICVACGLSTLVVQQRFGNTRSRTFVHGTHKLYIRVAINSHCDCFPFCPVHFGIVLMPDRATFNLEKPSRVVKARCGDPGTWRTCSKYTCSPRELEARNADTCMHRPCNPSIHPGSWRAGSCASTSNHRKV